MNAGLPSFYSIQELEAAMRKLASNEGTVYGLGRYSASMATITVAEIVGKLDLYARVIYPAKDQPSVRRVKWRDVVYEGTRRGTLYVLRRKNQAPMYFAISRTEVRKVTARAR